MWVMISSMREAILIIAGQFVMLISGVVSPLL